MPKYIDGDALLDWIIEAYADWCVNPIRGVFDHIKEMPNADVAPVKRGHWYAIGNTGLATCKCGFLTDRHLTYRYCPNCGTDTRGDADAEK